MKIRAQQCLTFPSGPMFGKGGGSSPAQVSTHCGRARALIAAKTPGVTPARIPTLYQEQCSGRDLRGFPQAGLPSSFNHTNVSLIYEPQSVQEDSQLTCQHLTGPLKASTLERDVFIHQGRRGQGEEGKVCVQAMPLVSDACGYYFIICP